MNFDMTNGVIPIAVFGYLDHLRKEHGISDKKWAKASDLFPTRISEVRRMYRKSAGEPDEGKVGRAFTVEKCISLVRGLRGILGDEAVRREMDVLIDSATDEELKIWLTLTTLSQDQRHQLWLYLEALRKTR